MAKKTGMIVLSLLIFLSYSNAQVNREVKDTLVVKSADPLKGLIKAGPNDLDPNIPIMLDGITTPVFSENLSLIQGDDFMKAMMSAEYIPEAFIDSNKVVKAFVLRKATEQEKVQMRGMQNDNDLQNENVNIGKEAFPFLVTDIFGNTYSLEKLKGKVIVINFWFVECKPCVMEIPELNDLVDKYKGKDVVFLGFATSDKSKIEKFLKTKTYKYNIIADCKVEAKVYNIKYFPAHLIIDKNSVIAYSVFGLYPTTISDLDKKIESLTK